MVPLPPPDPVHQDSQGEPQTRQLVGGPWTETRAKNRASTPAIAHPISSLAKAASETPRMYPTVSWHSKMTKTMMTRTGWMRRFHPIPVCRTWKAQRQSSGHHGAHFFTLQEGSTKFSPAIEIHFLHDTCTIRRVREC
eukprot:scaffold210768_cov66-Attheya_sp.AAC.2